MARGRPDARIRFTPRRRAGRRARALVWIGGALVWIAMLAAIAVVLHQIHAIEIALALTSVCCLAGIVLQLPLALRRHRRAR